MSLQDLAAACTIAGSDSGGGAGIQADLKTFTALGVYGLTVITAVTAQNVREVRGTWTLPADAVRTQIETVNDGFFIGAWKTGMLANREIVRAVAETLPGTSPLVIDPVMVSTSGYRLLDSAAIEDLVGLLLPMAAVVTPNIPEAEALTGMQVRTLPEMIEAGGRILDMGPGAVVVKGGHLAGGAAADVLVDADGTLTLQGARYPYAVHGSGCCFAAALAAFLSRGLDARQAFSAARQFIDAAIAGAIGGPDPVRIVNPGGTVIHRR